ncbi:hypothetical protein [Macellibacteroides fermentans]|uniref:hypothetical protein n=1 Tax=Macellibacteroides fermentans TaxID=879969 RepID=UPI00406D46DD
MAIQKLNYSFKKGCGKVAKDSYMTLQEELMKTLGCSTTQQYYQKRKGIVNIPVNVKEAIEAVFVKYDIDNPDEIWEITVVK